MNQKELVKAVISDLKKEFACKKTFLINPVYYSETSKKIFVHRCSCIQSEQYDFCIYYSETKNYFFFGGALPNGEFLSRGTLKINSNLLPKELIKVLKEVALKFVALEMKLNDDWTKTNIKLLE